MPPPVQRIDPETLCQINREVRAQIAWNDGSTRLCGRPFPVQLKANASGAVLRTVKPVTTRGGGVRQARPATRHSCPTSVSIPAGVPDKIWPFWQTTRKL